MKATLLIVLLTLFTSCEKEDNIETYNELFLTHHLPLGFSFSSTPSYVVFTLDGYVHKQDLLPIDAAFTTANSVKIVTGWNYVTALDIYDKDDNKIATGISVYNHKKGKPAHYISKEIPINIKGSYVLNEKVNVVCFVIPI